MKVPFLKRLSITSKLTLIILVVNLVLLALVAAILLMIERGHLEENLERDLTSLAEMVATNSNVGLSFLDSGAVNEVLRSLHARPYIMMAHVFTRDGDPFAQYYREDVLPLDNLINIKSLDEGELVQHNAENGDWLVSEGFNFQAAHAHAYTIKHVIYDKLFLGSIFIQADLSEFQQRLNSYSITMLVAMGLGLVLATLLARGLQGTLTRPVFHLRDIVLKVYTEDDYSVRARKNSDDELGELIDGFNTMLYSVEKRDQEILSLNRRLEEENQRMGAELEVTRKIQQMVLPKPSELQSIDDLDIAGYMLPADEVGGDYYDVLQHEGRIKIGIGDVTGHGLESGVVMLMVQTAVRALLLNNVTDPARFIDVINNTIFSNVERMDSDKNLTLSLFDYQEGTLHFTGQHEDILIVRENGVVECIDTTNYGFIVGLIEDIREFIACAEIHLNVGDSLVLYTDGITEARNHQNKLYGLERLCTVVGQNWDESAAAIQRATIDDVQHFADGRAFIDDITLLVVKRLC